MASKLLTRSNGKEADPVLAPDPALSATRGKPPLPEEPPLPIEEPTKEKLKRKNPQMQGLKPAMLNEPYRIEGLDMSSEEFVCWKISKVIIEPLGFKPGEDEENWRRVSNEAWYDFCQRKDKGRLKKAKSMADELYEDPILLDLLEKNLASRG